MTAVAQTLFDHPTEPFRCSDPDTAKDAARTIDGANQRREVLDALRALGDATADQVCDWLNAHGAGGWQRDVVSSRLSQLKDPRRYPQGTPVTDSGTRRPSNAGVSVIVFAPRSAE